MRYIRKLLYLVSVVIFVTTLIPVRASGLDSAQARLFKSGVLHFNIEEDADSCTTSATIPSSINLDPAIIAAIDQNKATYIQAGEQTDVPWQLMAAIHFRETGLRLYNPANGDGTYQILGRNYTPKDSITEQEFLEQAIEAGHFIQEKAQATTLERHRAALVYEAADNDPELIKDTMFSYNGRAQLYADQAARLGFDPATHPYEGSPYVMNNFDELHTGLLQDVSDEGVVLRPATQDGAFLIYAALAGISGSGCNNNGGDIVSIAAAEIGNKESDDSYLKYTGGVREAWCADFVSWVYNEAGRPFVGDRDGYLIPGAARLANYIEANGEWTSREANSRPPEPGDVIHFYRASNADSATGHHVGIVERVDGSTLYTIEGNTSNQVARRTYDNYLSDTYIQGWGHPNE